VTFSAVVVAVAATTFGIGFAPEAHRDEGEGEQAEAVEEGAMEAEAEEASHAEEDEDREGAMAGAIASSILISLAGVALVPLALVSARRSRVPVGFADRSQADRGHAVVGAASVVAALLSIGAAIVHFAVIAQHFDEWWLTGMFFLSIALFQLGWGLLVLIQPSALVYVTGAIANALIIVTWIVSRTTGVPVGPEAGEAEAVSLPDAMATAFEVGLIVVLVALLAERSARWPARRFPPMAAGLGSAAVVASLTGLALVILA
jgi:hypothetical protein